MAWAETVYGKPAEKQDTDDALPEIPPMYQRDKEAEATAKKADDYQRYMAKR